ncbi:MAG TPA: glycosyltransferase [Candidatus Acidoferrales bacterium]|nr:glycosyltransferase [Candidatus Acidoferrales bacterium]
MSDLGGPGWRPRVVLLFANTAEHNSRALRMTRTLVDAGCRVTWVARAAPGLPDHEAREGYEVRRVALPDGPRWLPAPRLPEPGTAPGSAAAGGHLLLDGPGRLMQALRYQLVVRRWAAAVERVAPTADVWQADGLVMLPVALRLRARRGGRVLYDSLEIHVESGRFARLPRAWRWLLARRERRWARSADAVVTVSRPYADVLARALGLRPEIVMNCPPAPARPAAGEPDGPPRPRRFHDLLALDPAVPVVLYHGYLFPHRGIERLFEAMDHVPGAHLVVMGFGPRFDAYREQAAVLRSAGRVHVVPGVPPEALLEWVASADVAAMPIEGSTLNHRLTTPNKLFEALAAGVPVVASDLPGMAAIIHETGAGLTCNPDDPGDIARAIRAVLEVPDAERSAYSARALAAARATYNWERQAKTYAGVLRSLGRGGLRASEAPPGAAPTGDEPA